MWTAVGVLASVFSISYILSRISIRKEPITTGGYLREFETEMLQAIQVIRKTPESDRYIENMDSSFYLSIKSRFETLCDRIAQLMNFNFNKDFAVCIKLVDVSSSRTTTSANEVYLRTFCRGGRDKQLRNDIDGAKVALKDNSDFLNIFNGARYFSCGNLFIYRLMKRLSFGMLDLYKNSTKKYGKRYNATVVVPIRLQSNYVTNPYGIWDQKGNQLLGFLCIDCKGRCSPFAIKKMAPYMLAFADNLYLLFDEILVSEARHISNHHNQDAVAAHTM